MKQLYFSFVHSYLNYGNIDWASVNKTKLKTLLRKQKHGVHNIDIELRTLNIYKLNIGIYTFIFITINK